MRKATYPNLDEVEAEINDPLTGEGAPDLSDPIKDVIFEETYSMQIQTPDLVTDRPTANKKLTTFVRFPENGNPATVYANGRYQTTELNG